MHPSTFRQQICFISIRVSKSCLLYSVSFLQRRKSVKNRRRQQRQRRRRKSKKTKKTIASVTLSSSFSFSFWRLTNIFSEHDLSSFLSVFSTEKRKCVKDRHRQPRQPRQPRQRKQWQVSFCILVFHFHFSNERIFLVYMDCLHLSVIDTLVYITTLLFLLNCEIDVFVVF